MLRYASAMSLLAMALAYALRRGGKPEGIAAAILVGIQIIDLLYHTVSGATGIYREVDLVHAGIDLLALVAIVWLALSADRFWTLWLGALQLIATLAHLIRVLDIEMYPIVYAVIIEGPFWGQMIVVALGTWLYARRQRRQQEAGHPISRRS